MQLTPDNDDHWQFPHTMVLKVFGDAEVPAGAPSLEDVVCALVARRVGGDFVPRGLSSRLSSGGKYLSVSLEVTVQDRAQLEALYADLRAEPRVRTAI